ncbi:MAG: Nif3-like dinuclear metal center hexameric protein, partial [Planctomycetota bacterium]
MPTITQIATFLESFAPLRLAEDWDNVGLLVGRRDGNANRVMTCLTVTPDSVAEAIERQADLIVTHHPLPFKPLKKLTTDSVPGQMLLDLVQAGIGIYSPHTAFDSAAAGINQQLAKSLGLEEIVPLVPAIDDPEGLGSGRYGRLDQAESFSG